MDSTTTIEEKDKIEESASSNSKDFVKKMTAGRHTKYDREKHIELLYTVFSRGEGGAAFCAEALISRRTFYDWLKQHGEFKEAYDIVLNLAERIWERYPLENKDMNYPYWQSIMKNRFRYGKSSFIFSADKTPVNIINDILQGLQEGEMNAEEALKIANLATIKCELENNITSNIQSNNVPETRESLLEKISKIQKVIDYFSDK